MSSVWTSESRERYRTQVTAQVNSGTRLLVILAATLFPAFLILDYLNHPNEFQVLALIRCATTLIYVLLYLEIKKGRFPWSRHSYLSALTILALASASITLMCVALGGYKSPYYAGVNLVVLAAGLGYPWNGFRMGVAVSVIIGIYLGGVLAAAGGSLGQPGALLNNLFFLVATGVISTATAHYSNRMRKESFERFTEIERTRDFLKKELESGQSSLDSLVEEVVNRRQELQETLRSLSSARDQAQQALQLREEFISIASHELKTPLTSMRIQAQLAKKILGGMTTSVDERLRRLIENQERQVERLVRLIGDLFDSSAARVGELQLNPAMMDLVETVSEVLDQFSADLRNEAILVRFKKTVPVQGHWDKSRIGQVIVNLITNAIKYGNKKPIDVSVRLENGHALLQVRDYGIGIPKEKQEKVFDQFERAVTHKSISGLGLGLYICQEIVKAHQGKILVESELGQGSQFTVMLPLSV